MRVYDMCMGKTKPKRYNLVMSLKLFRVLKREARTRDLSVARLIRQILLQWVASNVSAEDNPHV